MQFAHAASVAQLAHPGGANPSSLANFLESLNPPHPKALSTTIRGGAAFPDSLSTDWGHPNPAAQKPYLLNESRKLRGGSEGAHDLGTPQVLRAAGVQAIHCHDVNGYTDTLRREERPRGAAGRVGLKVEKIIGCSQVPKPHCVHALTNHISEVLKN